MEQKIEVDKGNVFLGTITHSGLIDHRMAAMFFAHATERGVLHRLLPSSLLASACNNLWCSALNNREAHDLRWFALLHADVVPEKNFVDKLIRIAEEHDADVLSAVIPIKDESGVTSTALSGPDPNFPGTFDVFDAFHALSTTLPLELQIPLQGDWNSNLAPRLLVNTGCMICRLDRDWCSKAYFTINDRITQEIGGLFNHWVEPEDWFFSRLVADLGGKVMATRAVTVEHLGGIPYRSNKVWGNNIDAATL
jgi:GT2 family glycosyltransferase